MLSKALDESKDLESQVEKTKKKKEKLKDEKKDYKRKIKDLNTVVEGKDDEIAKITSEKNNTLQIVKEEKQVIDN